MNDEMIMLIVVGVSCILAVLASYIFYRKKKAKAKRESNIPEDLLEELTKIDNKLKGGIKEDGTTTSPYKILWELAREKSRRQIEESTTGTIRSEQAIDNGELCQQSIRREDLQIRNPTGINKDKPINRKSKQNNLRRIVSRIRTGN